MTGTGPLGASDRSRESTAGLSDTSDPTPAPANDKIVTTAARPTAEGCVRDRRVDALVTTAPLGELADIRRTPRWLNSITIAACLVAVTAVWWLYRSEVANHVEMAAENQQLADLRQAQQQAEASAATYQGSLAQERDKAEKLGREVATGRRELETQKTALAKASDRTAENQQPAELRQARQQAEASAATYQGSLAQERDKAEKLASELATARGALETQAAALTKASDRTAENQQLAELRQARQQAEASATAYQESLAQERAPSQALEQQLAAHRDATPRRGRKNTTSTLYPTPGRGESKTAQKPPP